MNKVQIGQLLTLAAGFDNRKVDRITTEAWALIPELQQADYEAAKAAVVAHQTGPKRHEYLTVAHIVDALTEGRRNSTKQVEADVRSAKARRLIDQDWPARELLPAEVQDALQTLRDMDRRYADQNAIEAY